MRYIKTYENQSKKDYENKIKILLDDLGVNYVEFERDDQPYLDIYNKSNGITDTYWLDSLGIEKGNLWVETYDVEKGNEYIWHVDDLTYQNLLELYNIFDATSIKSLIYSACERGNYDLFTKLIINNKDKVDYSNMFDYQETYDLIDAYDILEVYEYGTNNYNLLKELDVQKWIIDNRNDKIGWLFEKVKPHESLDDYYIDIVDSHNLGLL